MSEVVPLPSFGEVFFDARGQDRVLRVTWHEGTLVLSLWRGEMCTASFRMPMEDVGRLIETLDVGFAEAGGQQHEYDVNAVSSPEMDVPEYPGTGQYARPAQVPEQVAYDPAFPGHDTGPAQGQHGHPGPQAHPGLQGHGPQAQPGPHVQPGPQGHPGPQGQPAYGPPRVVPFPAEPPTAPAPAPGAVGLGPNDVLVARGTPPQDRLVASYGDAAPRDMAPRDMPPRDMASGEGLPGEPTPWDAMPREAMPRDPMPRENPAGDDLPYSPPPSAYHEPQPGGYHVPGGGGVPGQYDPPAAGGYSPPAPGPYEPQPTGSYDWQPPVSHEPPGEPVYQFPSPVPGRPPYRFDTGPGGPVGPGGPAGPPQPADPQYAPQPQPIAVDPNDPLGLGPQPPRQPDPMLTRPYVQEQVYNTGERLRPDQRDERTEW